MNPYVKRNINKDNLESLLEDESNASHRRISDKDQEFEIGKLEKQLSSR